MVLFLDSVYPSVQFCPGDQLKVTDGQSTTSWIEAAFSSNVVLPIVKNYNEGICATEISFIYTIVFYMFKILILRQAVISCKVNENGVL